MAKGRDISESSGEYAGVKHKVPARNVGRVLLEVDIASDNGCAIGGQPIPRGKHRVLVYKDELDAVYAKVRKPEHVAAWQAAERAYRLAADREFGRLSADARAKAEARWGESVSKFYCNANGGKGYPPIITLRVLEDNVPPPETQSNVQANQIRDLTEALASVLRAAAPAPAKAQTGR